MTDNGWQQYIQALLNFPDFAVEIIDPVTAEPRLWFRYTPDNLGAIQTVLQTPQGPAVVAAELVFWGRAVAATKRVWQYRDREFRQWKGAITVEMLRPPKGEDGAKWKAPAQYAIEATYRGAENYARLAALSEQAEEAHNTCLAIQGAWEALARSLAR